MAQEDTSVAAVSHDVHGIRHAHEARVVGAKLFPGEFLHTGALTRCLVQSGTTGLRDDFGNSFSATMTAAIGPGFRCVNVQLSGWDLNFLHQDHHIDRIQVRISNVTYNATTGSVSFTVSGFYRDRNGDDDFQWEVFFTILALG
jgi:hypothetical protein